MASVGPRGVAAARGRAVANAMTGADFSDKWNGLKPAERRLTGIRAAELADPAAEAQAIALALREALETPGRTAALVTPDRMLAARVSALLERWGIEADDSAGQGAVADRRRAPCCSASPPRRPRSSRRCRCWRCSSIRWSAARATERLDWLDAVRDLDLALRGPRPAAGLSGLDEHFAAKDADRQFRAASLHGSRCGRWWRRSKPAVGASIARRIRGASWPRRPDGWPATPRGAGPTGAWPRSCSPSCRRSRGSGACIVAAEDAVPLLRQLLDARSVRPPYGGHPRIFIWGLLEARLQHADLMVLGGLNEGVWPALPAPDPWLAPKIRANLGLPGLDFRIGLAAHDFASALGAPRVLITRARRDSRSPTVASRFWLRLQAMTGGLARDIAARAAGRGARRSRASSSRPTGRAPSPAERPAARRGFR